MCTMKKNKLFFILYARLRVIVSPPQTLLKLYNVWTRRVVCVYVKTPIARVAVKH